jgi:hypothetical protein
MALGQPMVLKNLQFRTAPSRAATLQKQLVSY